MKFIEWHTRFAEHTLAEVEERAADWEPGATRTTDDGRRGDYDVEWPHITGDDSGFWQQMMEVPDAQP